MPLPITLRTGPAGRNAEINHLHPGGFPRGQATRHRPASPPDQTLALTPWTSRYPPIARSQDMWLRHQGGRGDSWLFDDIPRYCPRCLAGDGSSIQRQYGCPWRLIWHLPICFACTDHQVLLRHDCPGGPPSTAASRAADQLRRRQHPAPCPVPPPRSFTRQRMERPGLRSAPGPSPPDPAPPPGCRCPGSAAAASGRSARTVPDQVLAEPAPVRAPDSGLHRGDPAHVGIRGDPAQDDTAGQDGGGGQLRGEPDQDCLLLLGNESRGAQACGEVSRLVVGAGMPPDCLAAPGEVVPLPGDQPVEFCSGYSEFTLAEDVAAVPADDPQQRPVPLISHPSGRLGL
jgi:hypothetical protein